jgi:pimeloyl-ACP methyl ester carboxylesterase
MGNFRVYGDAPYLLAAYGRLLSLTEQIPCPVTAIHGDYDPHPAAGVFEPLSTRVQNFRFILVDKCGHKPWIERQAKQRFFSVLRQELLDA